MGETGRGRPFSLAHAVFIRGSPPKVSWQTLAMEGTMPNEPLLTTGGPADYFVS